MNFDNNANSKERGKENGHLKITGILRIFSTPFYSRHARFRRDHNLEIDPDKCDSVTLKLYLLLRVTLCTIGEDGF